MNDPKQWNSKYVWGYVVILALLAIWELVAVLDNNPATPPLTWVTVKYVSPIAAIPLFKWLYDHFVAEYKKEGKNE